MSFNKLFVYHVRETIHYAEATFLGNKKEQGDAVKKLLANIDIWAEIFGLTESKPSLRGLTESKMSLRGLTESKMSLRGLTESKPSLRGLTESKMSLRGLTESKLSLRGLTESKMSLRGLTESKMSLRGLTESKMSLRGLTESKMSLRGLTFKELFVEHTLAAKALIDAKMYCKCSDHVSNPMYGSCKQAQAARNALNKLVENAKVLTKLLANIIKKMSNKNVHKEIVKWFDMHLECTDDYITKLACSKNIKNKIYIAARNRCIKFGSEFGDYLDSLKLL